MIKINILYNIINNPTGGGNQFLRNLKKALVDKNCYTEPENADVIIFNSHHHIKEVIKLKKKYPNKIFIHRIDGPMKRVTANNNDKRDDIAYIANKYLADATIFQSQYSMEANIQQKIPRNRTETIIMNSTDSAIFNCPPNKVINKNEKIRLVATSWSNNMNKGFGIYDYLDKNLNFDKYEMSFVGNSPIEFKNIKSVPPLNTENLAQFLKTQDIYITACKDEPCSNALIEALMCGLPALCLNSGSNPEILGKGGLLFDKPEQISTLLEEITNNYQKYQSQINCQTMDETTSQYIALAKKLVDDYKSNDYKVKQINFCQEYVIHLVIWYERLYAKYLLNIKNKFKKLLGICKKREIA